MKAFGGGITRIRRSLLGMLSAVAFSGWSQGMILFKTHIEGLVDARFHDGPCHPGAGVDFVAQLLVGASADSLVPMGTPIPFGTGDKAGYLDGGVVVTPFAPQSTAFVVIRYWESRYTSYEEAGSGAHGTTPVVAVVLGGSNGSITTPPVHLIGLSSFGVGCPLDGVVELGIKRTGGLTTLSWRQPSSPFTVVVLQESDSPAGPWTDISGPWTTESGSKVNPPNPLTLLSTNLSKFYRARLTTNIGP